MKHRDLKNKTSEGNHYAHGCTGNSKHPPWLTRKVSADDNQELLKIIRKDGLHTVCQEACCPNIWECFRRRHATFMILGKHCTRNCRFCAVGKGPLSPPDPEEAEKVARVAQEIGLKHIVITSVTRDDLPDGGAWLFALTVKKIKEHLPGATVEVLTPDFQGDTQALTKVLAAEPEIFNHNVETVPRLYPAVRPEADYRRSLEVLEKAKSISPRVTTKSGLMVGLGERREEILQVARDLRAVGCDLLTVGQYLRPSSTHHPVVKYYSPEEFADMEQELSSLGFSHVAAAPLVRSSYRADEIISSL